MPDNVTNKWIWKYGHDVEYPVKRVYHIVTHNVHHDRNSHSNILWNKVVPLKVLLLAWRTINKRISIKGNLICHGVHSFRFFVVFTWLWKGKKLLIMFFSIVISLVVFVLQLCNGWGFLVFIPLMVACIPCNLMVHNFKGMILVIAYRWFCWLHYGWFRMNITRNFFLQ